MFRKIVFFSAHYNFDIYFFFSQDAQKKSKVVSYPNNPDTTTITFSAINTRQRMLEL